MRWLVHLPSGRTGLLHTKGARKSLVQFGSSGPFESVWNRDLRDATQHEVNVVTGQVVEGKE